MSQGLAGCPHAPHPALTLACPQLPPDRFSTLMSPKETPHGSPLQPEALPAMNGQWRGADRHKTVECKPWGLCHPDLPRLTPDPSLRLCSQLPEGLVCTSPPYLTSPSQTTASRLRPRLAPRSPLSRPSTHLLPGPMDAFQKLCVTFPTALRSSPARRPGDNASLQPHLLEMPRAQRALSN